MKYLDKHILHNIMHMDAVAKTEAEVWCIIIIQFKQKIYLFLGVVTYKLFKIYSNYSKHVLFFLEEIPVM